VYQASVLAVILFVNGVQIPLSAPAIVEGNTTWVPLRSVFEQLGWQVAWDGATNSVKVTAPNHPDILIRSGDAQVQVGAETIMLDAAPRYRGAVTYIPASFLAAALGAELKWDNEQKALHIDLPPPGEPIPVKVEQLTNNPPDWVNKKVIVTGEYTGWRPDPFDAATSSGPPVTRSDWTVHDDTGSIYCVAGSTRDRSPISLRPYEDWGRRIQVTGIVQLAERGFPYLEPVEITALTGLPGLTCYLSTDRSQYQPGQTVVMKMTVTNPFDEPVTLKFTSGKTYDFIIRDHAGQKVWQWSDGKVFTQALQQRELAAGESYEVSARWTVPEGENKLPAGLYHIKGIINQDLSAYRRTIRITDSD